MSTLPSPITIPSYPPNQSRPSPSNAARHICQEARLVLTSLRGGPPYIARGDFAFGLKVRNCFVHHTRNNISSSSNNNNSIQAQLVTKQQLFFVTNTTSTSPPLANKNNGTPLTSLIPPLSRWNVQRNTSSSTVRTKGDQLVIFPPPVLAQTLLLLLLLCHIELISI